MPKKKSPDTTTRVLRLRLKDKHAPALRAMSRDVNFVWNYCNELSAKVLEREGHWMSGFDLQKYLNGASKEGLSVGSVVFQQVAEEFATRRKQFKKRQLRWRVSNRKSTRYSLGWIPFKARALSYNAGQVTFQRLKLSLWDSYGLAGYKLGSGSISEDSRGRWYLNVCVEVAKPARPASVELDSAIGIDLGLKDLASCSDGDKVEAQRFYRDLEEKISSAQRAGKKGRVRALHAKVVNRRKDHLHKLSTSQARSFALVAVGNVNASALARTGMAKSVLDAGWSAYRTMLKYKCDDAGAWFVEVDERYSTQECSLCGTRAGPKGQEGLSVRRWRCVCGVEHDRDTNAARVIRNRGMAWLSRQFSGAVEAEAYDAASNEVAALAAAAAGHGRPAVGIPVL